MLQSPCQMLPAPRASLRAPWMRLLRNMVPALRSLGELTNRGFPLAPVVCEARVASRSRLKAFC